MRFLFFVIIIFSVFAYNSFASVSSRYIQNNELLKSDLDAVWPLVNTVKVEYELVLAQLEFIEKRSEREQFLEDYEHYVKKQYLSEVLSLNIRQGKLLLLLIERELEKTPYELLVEYRSRNTANFWQKMARLVGANLKDKYSVKAYPHIESTLQKHFASDLNPMY